MTAPTIDLEKLTLARGGHASPSEGVCVMEAVTLLAGEKFGDRPTCVSPVIGAYLRNWNDALEEEPRQRLKPYALKVIGTNTGAADDEVRAWMATDWLVRVQTPTWLELAGLKDEAAELRALPALTSSEIAVACQATIDKARTKAGLAANAARDAARAAARDAARDAAWDAARDAAWDAARDAAWAAARAAARDAARAAARDAAWDAARAAARDVAWDAARAAAYEAARSALRPTEQQPMDSAFDLLDRMIAVGQVEDRMTDAFRSARH